MDRRTFLRTSLVALGGVALTACVPSSPSGPAATAFPARSATTTAEADDWLALPAGWDVGWRAAYRDAATTPAWLTILGDSIAEGVGSGDAVRLAWPVQVRARLAASLPWHGDFWPAWLAHGRVSGAAPFEVTGETLAWPVGGYGRLPLFAARDDGVITFTAPAAARLLDVVSLDLAPGKWSLTPGQEPPREVHTDGSGEQRRISLSAPDAGAPTLRCAGQSGPRVMAIQGVCAYANPAAGVGFANVSISGQRATHFIDPGMATPTMLGYWDAGFSFPTQPHLAIVALGINDCQVGVPLARYREALRLITERLRVGRPSCSILLVANANPTRGMLQPFARADQYPAYVAAMRELARDHGYGFASIHARWADPLADGLVTPTDPHPNATGHRAMAEVLAPLILPRP